MTRAHISSRLSVSNSSPVLPEGMILFPLDGGVMDTLDSIPISLNNTTIDTDYKKFYGSVGVEDSTTNLITNPDASLSGWTGAVYTRTLVTSGQWEGWYRVDVTNVGTGKHICQIPYITLDASTTYTFSLEYYNPNDDIEVRVDGNSNYGPMTPTTGYQLVKTVTVGTTGGQPQNIWFYHKTIDNAPTTSHFYYRNAQAEKKDHATSFIKGSRPLGRLRYDISSLAMMNAGCISCWVYNSDGMINNRGMNGGPPNNQYIIKLGSDLAQAYNDCVTIRIPGDSRRVLDLVSYVNTTIGSSASGTTSLKSFPLGSWIHLVIQWDKNGLPSGNTREIYLNGVLEVGDNNVSTLPAKPLILLHLGNWDDWNSLMPCTFFEQLAVHPSKGFSPDVIESWYKAGGPFFDSRDSFSFI